MVVPGVSREHQNGLDELGKSFTLGRDAITHSAGWEQRLDREAREAERERMRAEERQRTGLPPEPPREQQREARGLGLGR